MPASSAARTHWVATSFSTCEPCVSQLPKVISETLKPLFPRYLNSMGFTLTQLVAQGKGLAVLGSFALEDLLWARERNEGPGVQRRYGMRRQGLLEGPRHFMWRPVVVQGGFHQWGYLGNLVGGRRRV